MTDKERLAKQIEQNRREMIPPEGVRMDRLIESAVSACCDPEPRARAATAPMRERPINPEELRIRIESNKLEMREPAHLDWDRLADRMVQASLTPERESPEHAWPRFPEPDWVAIRRSAVEDLPSLFAAESEPGQAIWSLAMTLLGAALLILVVRGTLTYAKRLALQGSFLFWSAPLLAIVTLIGITCWIVKTDNLRTHWLRQSFGAFAGGCILAVVGITWMIQSETVQTTKNLSANMVEQSVSAAREKVREGEYPKERAARGLHGTGNRDCQRPGYQGHRPCAVYNEPAEPGRQGRFYIGHAER